MRDILAKLGVKKLDVLPNPISSHRPTTAADPAESPWLCAARLTGEKGLADLLASWPQNEPLLVGGDGTERAACEEAIRIRNLRVSMLGDVSNAQLRDLMGSCEGLVFASKALEGSPLVYAEALQAGLPVLAASGSTVASQVLLDNTGVNFDLGNSESLLAALAAVRESRETFSSEGKQVFQSRHTPDYWLSRITHLYRSVIESGRQH